MLSELKKLREHFLNPLAHPNRDYWTDTLLETYSRTLGERIRWKWQHFLTNLNTLKLDPETLFPSQTFLLEDWGCGPGTAAVAFLEKASMRQRYNLSLSDRSCEATRFATRRLMERFTDLKIGEAPNSDGARIRIRLISYVLSELSALQLNDLTHELRNFDIFMWVDAGSRAESRMLSKLRDSLLDNFIFLAPCPHSFACPLAARPDDWCHRFARAPREIFHSAEWAEISRELKIDLRSLPYHSLYGVRRALLAESPTRPEMREIGRARVSRHSLQRDFCTHLGTYTTEILTKRQDPELFKKIRKRQET